MSDSSRQTAASQAQPLSDPTAIEISDATLSFVVHTILGQPRDGTFVDALIFNSIDDVPTLMSMSHHDIDDLDYESIQMNEEGCDQ